MELTTRLATADDIPAVAGLVEAAVRGISPSAYGPQQIESGLRYIFGLDTQQLIADGTYYVAEAEGQLIGAGGWSRRATLYRGEQAGAGQEQLLDPARDAARIRAFYVHPRWARRGVGRRLLMRCEAAAHAAGFSRLELMATLPGAPLYTAGGFVATRPVEVKMPDGVTLPCIHMAKALLPPPLTP
jgi:GNAT superfamily N-acetyltransferase